MAWIIIAVVLLLFILIILAFAYFGLSAFFLILVLAVPVGVLLVWLGLAFGIGSAILDKKRGIPWREGKERRAALEARAKEQHYARRQKRREKIAEKKRLEQLSDGD